MVRRFLVLWPLLLMVGLLGAAAMGADQPAGAPPAATAQPAQAAPAPQMTPEDKADEEIGKSAAEEAEKQFKVVKDSPDLPRINAIIDRLKPATQKPYLQYHAKVIDTGAINAFSLPGGYLYFTRGLLDAVESDDELAAVAGHEMAHICLNHSRKMMNRSDKYSKVLGPLVLASILSRSDRVDPGAMLVVGSLVVEDALNHYGRAAELEADHEAVLYLKNSTAYNPVAMLTVAEGLAHMESSEPQIDMGVAQTHPDATERIAAISKELTDLSIPIERRRVTKSLTTSAVAVKVNDSEIGELRISASGGSKPWSEVVFQPAVEYQGQSPLTRATQASVTFNTLLLADLRPLEVSSIRSDGSLLVRGRDQDLFTITPGDAAFHKTTVDKLAAQAMQAIRTGFQQEKVGRAY